MTKEELERERRLQVAYERLGSMTPKCLDCSETNPHCLELDHVAGRKFHRDTVILCLNCHRKRTELQRGAPKPIGGVPSQLENIGQYLLGVANFLAMIVARLQEFGLFLIGYAVQLRAI